MHPLRRRKLKVIVLILVLVSFAVGLVLYALRQNISLFYSPIQLATENIPPSRIIRVGGVVVPGSVVHASDGLTVSFQLTDYQRSVEVNYHGILPDLFREGQGVVTRGQLIDKQHVKAIEVLAKHDEKYMPPEVKSALKKANT